MSMTKPDWCPQRVWDEGMPKAIEFVDWLGRDTVDADAEQVLTTTIARAILAAEKREREACAQVLEGASTAVNSKRLAAWGDLAPKVAGMLAERDLEIAQAIRNRNGE